MKICEIAQDDAQLEGTRNEKEEEQSGFPALDLWSLWKPSCRYGLRPEPEQKKPEEERKPICH